VTALASSSVVMLGLVPVIHVIWDRGEKKDADGGDEPGHDGRFAFEIIPRP
jgi:hypothetical protein